VAQSEDEIIAAGAEIIWVLEQGSGFTDGTAENCIDTMEALGATQGWCVGDDESLPAPDVFDDSEFAIGRGFDLIVPRSTMTIDWVSTHGTPSGNDNLDGDDVLQAVEDIIGGL